MAAPKDAWTQTEVTKIFDREPWVAGAACSGHPRSDVFFTSRGDHAGLSIAKEICSQCSVWKDCLKFALDNHEQHGIWGGLAIRERRKVRHTDTVKKCSKCKLIKCFPSKAQTTCDRCLDISSRKHKVHG